MQHTPEKIELYLAVEAKLALLRAVRGTLGTIRVQILEDVPGLEALDFYPFQVVSSILWSPADQLPNGRSIATWRARVFEFEAARAAALKREPTRCGPLELVAHTRDGIVLTLPLHWRPDVEYALNRDREEHVLFAASVYDAPVTWAQVHALRVELLNLPASGMTELLTVHAFAPDLVGEHDVTREALARLHDLKIRRSWPHEVLGQLTEHWHATTLADVLATLPRVGQWETQAMLEATQDAIDDAVDGVRMRRPELTRKGARAYLRDQIRTAYLTAAAEDRIWNREHRTFAVPVL